MPEFGPSIPDSQDSIQALAGIALVLLVLRILVAVAASVWIFRDAEARRKNGIAAALIALLSAFYGMPVINADQAKTVIVLKRSMAAGFAGVDNPLFVKPNTRMLFGDAKASLQQLVSEFKEA